MTQDDTAVSQKKPANKATSKKTDQDKTPAPKRTARKKNPKPTKNLELENATNSGEEEAEVRPVVAEAGQHVLSLNLTKSLYNRIRLQAEDEGVSMEDLVQEFLAESVTLRAWEILERKAQMKIGPNSNNPQHRGNGQQHNNNQRRGKGRMNHNRYQNIMDDKANFLEYVRTQERNRR